MSHQIQLRDGMRRLAQGINTCKSIYDPSTAVRDTDNDYIYRAWLRRDASGYIAIRLDKATQAETQVTDTGAIPADIKVLTYS